MSQLFFDFRNKEPADFRDLLSKRFTFNVFSRDRFGLFEEYVDWVVAGRKKTTIRFRRGQADFPVSELIPVFATSPTCPHEGPNVGWARIINLRIILFGELNDNDAHNDGFSSLEQLQKALTDIYGEISVDEFVSVYEFAFIRDAPNSKST